MFYSQLGQDQWVVNVLKDKRNGFFVDIGAFDGVNFSNTAHLEREKDWTGICVEPLPEPFKKLRSLRACVCENACIGPVAGRVKLIQHEDPMFSAVVDTYTDQPILNYASNHPERIIETDCLTFKDLLNKYKVPAIIDYLSLDIEGAEYEVLKDFPFDSYSFRVMTIETNIQQGGKNIVKRNEIQKLLVSKGYVFVMGHRCDDFYQHPNFLA